jgi:hypothetical protein
MIWKKAGKAFGENIWLTLPLRHWRRRKKFNNFSYRSRAIFTPYIMGPGNTKGEVSLYQWPPVWLVWNQLYDNWQFLFSLQNRLIQTSKTGGQWYSDTSPFIIPWPRLKWLELLLYPPIFYFWPLGLASQDHCLGSLPLHILGSVKPGWAISLMSTSFGTKVYFMYYIYLESGKAKLLSDPRKL